MLFGVVSDRVVPAGSVMDETNHSIYREVLGSNRDEVIGYPVAFHSFT
jgi:hypothetical protein